MKRTKIFIKLISLLLSAVCALSLMSCSKGLFDDMDASEEELRAVGKIGDYEVCYDELYYLIMSCKDIMKAKYGNGIWKDEAVAAEYADELEAMVLERITANYAVLTLCEEYGFEDPLENKDIVESVYDEIDGILYSLAIQNDIPVTLNESLTGELIYDYEKGGRDEALNLFRKALEETYLTERVMRLTLATETAFKKLSDILTGEKNEIIYSDTDISSFMLSDEFICTRHIFVEKGSSEESRALAEEALEMLRNGTSMELLIGSKYNDDVTAPSEGYYFTYGEMDEAYESAAFALEEGEISDIVETDDGFFIIKRCEKSSSYMMSNIATFTEQIIYAKVNIKVSARQAELRLELNDFGSSLEFYRIAVAEEVKSAD